MLTLSLLMMVVCGVALGVRKVGKGRAANVLPTVQELRKHEENEAWRKLGEKEVELFLAPYTTTDEEIIILPTSDAYEELARLVRKEGCEKALGKIWTDVEINIICTYANERAGGSGTKSNVLHALDPSTICLPESWSGQARAKANELHKAKELHVCDNS